MTNLSILSPAFTSMATVTATIKRPGAMSGGVRGVPVVSTTEYAITPLDSYVAETRLRPELAGPYELRQTFMESETVVDIREGYTLVVSGIDYPIKSVAEYVYDQAYFYHIIVEELRP